MAFLRSLVDLFKTEELVRIPQPWWKADIYVKQEVFSAYKIGAVAGGLAFAAGAVALVRAMRPRKLRLEVDPARTDGEGLCPGNPLLEGCRIPGCQVTLALRKDDKLYIVGAGIRIENYLVTAAHNIQCRQDLYAIGRDGEFKIDTSLEISIAPDVSAFLVAESTWSRLGVSIAKLGPLLDGSAVSVTSSCDQRGSVAVLELARVGLGRVYYNGSTQPGFSGSAYMNGSVCVGMHTHGGAQAGGYETLYLYSRLKLATAELPESSEWMVKHLVKRRHHYEIVGDAVVVRDDTGHYHISDKELLEQVERRRQMVEQAGEIGDVDFGRGVSWVDEMQGELAQEELDRRGYVPEGRLPQALDFSGEFQGPPVKARRSLPAGQKSQGSSSSARKTRPKPIDRQALMNRLSSVSSKDLAKFLELRKKPTSDTSSLTPVQQQSSALSVSNPGVQP
ncbi:hypothetical protein 1 [Wuchan romanomermis nematode virus 3]|uniref:hypothetical protein 1 n=1 Tax=Wuchan romanomermis nematode virus 3 TaxID=1923687 RepID=UPI00090A14E3|nr:hypothetical protein 1 [Wuchan romanomermis nematode virus 3]APG75889.1 hypothetical protein 1 [Wuchan romanomermis nematode virus 3]